MVISRMGLLKKEQLYNFFFLFFFSFLRGGGTIFPQSRFIKAMIFITHVHCRVVHLSPFEVSDIQVFLSRLPKLIPWKSRLPKFES